MSTSSITLSADRKDTEHRVGYRSETGHLSSSEPPLRLGCVRQSMLEPIHHHSYVQRADEGRRLLLVAHRHGPPLLQPPQQPLDPAATTVRGALVVHGGMRRLLSPALLALIGPLPRCHRDPSTFPEERGCRFGRWKSRSAGVLRAVSDRRYGSDYLPWLRQRRSMLRARAGISPSIRDVLTGGAGRYDPAHARYETPRFRAPTKPLHDRLRFAGVQRGGYRAVVQASGARSAP